MDRALRNVPAAGALHRQIGQVGGEEHIVLAERRAEQRCLPAPDGQPEFRKHSGVVTEEAVAGAADIAVGVGHGKAIALLEGGQPMRLSRCGGVQGRKCYRGIKLALVELGHSLHISLVSPPEVMPLTTLLLRPRRRSGAHRRKRSRGSFFRRKTAFRRQLAPSACRAAACPAPRRLRPPWNPR